MVVVWFLMATMLMLTWFALVVDPLDIGDRVPKPKVLHLTTSFMPPTEQGDFQSSKLANHREGQYVGGRIGGIPCTIEALSTYLTDFEHHLLLPSDGHMIVFGQHPTEYQGWKCTEVRNNLTIHFFPNCGELDGYPYANYTFEGLLERKYPDFEFDIIMTHVVNPDLDLSEVNKKVRWINATHGSPKNAELSATYHSLIDAHWLYTDWQRNRINDESKVVVIPHPIDRLKYSSRSDLSESIVWHGRIDPNKQILDFSLILAKHKDIPLHIIGGPDQEDMFLDYQQPATTFMKGRLTQTALIEELCQHKYGVITSEQETFCVSLLQMLAAGCEVHILDQPALEWAYPYVYRHNSLEEIALAIGQPQKPVSKLGTDFDWDTLRSAFTEMLIGYKL